MDRTPLRIGYCLSLSGALASNGKTARLAHQIWQENVNTHGKLLGRPVALVCLDDETNPKLVADSYDGRFSGGFCEPAGGAMRTLAPGATVN